MSILILAVVTIIPAGASFQCPPVRERDGRCCNNQPCPSVIPKVSRDALVALIGQPQGLSNEGLVLVIEPIMTCVSVGPAGGSRTGAWCQSPQGGDISCRMVQTGFALRWDRYWKGTPANEDVGR